MHRISDIKKPQVSTCEVRAKNGWETIFEPVLGHIKFLGQIKAPPMLEWGLEHPGRPRGTLYPRKKLYLPKSHMGYHFCYWKFFVRPPLQGGPLVKFSNIGMIQYFTP